jgi:hypothetical protein
VGLCTIPHIRIFETRLLRESYTKLFWREIKTNIKPILFTYWTKFKYISLCWRRSQSYITTDSQSAIPSWCQAPIWDTRPIFFILEIFFKQLRVYYFLAPSLTRGRACNLLLLPVLVSAVPLGYESRGTQNHILLSHLRLPNLESQVPVFISPRNMLAQTYSRALCSLFVAFYDSQGYDGGILSRLHTGIMLSNEYTHRSMWITSRLLVK